MDQDPLKQTLEAILARLAEWVVVVPLTLMIRAHTRMRRDIDHLRRDVAVLQDRCWRMWRGTHRASPTMTPDDEEDD